jgi:hypothetical protein
MKEEREHWSKICNTLMDEKKQAALGFDLAKWKVKVSSLPAYEMDDSNDLP